jgi:sulfate permease, SulP family
VKPPGFLRRLRPGRGTSADLTAGLVLGVESVPDALASGVLAGVNPLFALYAVMLATPVGAFFASSVFLSVQTTSAMSLVVASVPGIGADSSKLFMLSLLTGVIMLAAGILKLGRLMRFVSNSVMVGFMNGVALLIILGQLGDFTGYSSEYSNKVVKAVDLLFHLNGVDLPTLVVGVTTIVLIIVLERTRLKALGMVVAIIVASILPFIFHWDSVMRVYDIALITKGLPRPSLPGLGAIAGLLVPALSLAVIGLIQGAGVSQSYVNPDGRYPNASRDFVGQGAANVATGLFQGMPVGGSVSATALVVQSGARSRLANIFAGIVIAVVTLLFAGAVGKLAMPALAGLLILIGFRSLKPARAWAVWRTGNIQRVIMVMTFALVLMIPLQYAVLSGVGLSIVLYTVRQSNRVSVMAWTIKEGSLPIEAAAPATVAPGGITVLVPYGSLFYAAAPVLEEKLPVVDQHTADAVVIMNLRGKDELGSTFMTAMERYAADLKKHESRLMLAEVDPLVREQLARAGIVDSISRRNIFLRTDKVGESLFDAYAAAEEWVAQHQPQSAEAPGPGGSYGGAPGSA